jgi:hypothetical protein
MTEGPEKNTLAERAADLSDTMFESAESRRRGAMQAGAAHIVRCPRLGRRCGR